MLELPELKGIESKFDIELWTILNELKITTFGLFSSKKIKITVNNYYSALLLLESQAKLNLASYPANHPLSVTGENIIISLQNFEGHLLRRYGKYIDHKNGDEKFESRSTNIITKVMCALSVDQIGIILRAADESKIILAKSLSLIFRMIVPFLSTKQNTNISWNSMRKSSYQIEQNDKDVAVATLEKMITKIRQY